MSLADRVAGLQVDNPHLDALKQAESALKEGSSEAVQAKLDALVRLDRFEAAAEFLKSKGDAQKYPSLAAYIYYQTNQVTNLRDLVTKNSSNFAVLSSLAQLEYRLGQYADALNTLEKCSSLASTEDDKLAIVTNRYAVMAAQGRTFEYVEGVPRFDYEFNLAFAYIQRGDYDSALAKLQAAKSLTADEHDVEDVQLQAAYVEILRQNPQTARELLELCSESVVSRTNRLALEQLSGEIEQVVELIAGPQKLEVPSNAPAVQQRIFASNAGQLAASVGQKPKSKQLAKLAQLGDVAVATVDRFTSAEDLKELRRRSKLHPSSIPLAFALAQSLAQAQAQDQDQDQDKDKQIANNQHRTAEAANVLVRLLHSLEAAKVPIEAGVLGAAVAGLRLLQKRKDSVTSTVASLVRSQVLAPSAHTAAAVLLAQSGDPEHQQLAADLFESAPAEIRAAGLAAVKGAATDLPSVESLTAGQNLNELLSEERQAISTSSAKTTKAKPARVEKNRPRKRRTGAKKLPKSYDETKQPDPERWLAKQDRSSYKPKKKGSNSQASQGQSQGSSKPIPAATPSAKPAAAVKSAAAKNKKKKKGKK